MSEAIDTLIIAGYGSGLTLKVNTTGSGSKWC